MFTLPKISVGILIAVFGGGAVAYDGNDLKSGLDLYKQATEHGVTLQSSELLHAARSFGYVNGVVDSLNGGLFCVPQAAQASQYIDLVHIYLKANPQYRHNEAVLQVTGALSAKYPCKKPGNGAAKNQ